MDPLEFLARVVSQIPNPGQVMQRDEGWYASRTRGERRQQGLTAAGPAEVVIVELGSRRAARARRAELLRRIVEVDPRRGPPCQGGRRVVAVITAPTVIARERLGASLGGRRDVERGWLRVEFDFGL